MEWTRVREPTTDNGLMDKTTKKRKRWGVIEPTSTTPPPTTAGPISQPASIQAAVKAALNDVLPKFGPHNLPPPPPKRPRSDGKCHSSVSHRHFVDNAASNPLHRGRNTQILQQTSPTKGTPPAQQIYRQPQAAPRTSFDSKEAALKVLQRRKRLEAWKEMMKCVDKNKYSGDDGNLNDVAVNAAATGSCSASGDAEREDAATHSTIAPRDEADMNSREKSNGNFEFSSYSRVRQETIERNQSKPPSNTSQLCNSSSSPLRPSERTDPLKENAINSRTGTLNKSPPLSSKPRQEGASRSHESNHMEMDPSTKITFGREFLNFSHSIGDQCHEEGVVEKPPAVAMSTKPEGNATPQEVDKVKEKQTSIEKGVNNNIEGNNIKNYASSLMDKLRVLEQKIAAAPSSPVDDNRHSVVETAGEKIHSKSPKQSEAIDQKQTAESPVKAQVSRAGKEPTKKTHLAASKETGKKKKISSGKKKNRLFQQRLAIPVATTTDTTTTVMESTGNTHSNSEAPSIVSVSQMEDSTKPTTTKKSRKTANNRKKSEKTDASSALTIPTNLWDYDYNPSESSDSEGDHDFLLRVDVDIAGDGEMIWSKALPRKDQNDDIEGKSDDILRSRISSVQEQIRRADALIQSTVPSYLEFKSKGWMELDSLPTTAKDEHRKLVPVPPSEKLHASSHAAREFLSLLKATALKANSNSNPLANDKVMEFLTIIKESRINIGNDSSITNPYQLMKRVWNLIQSMTCGINQNEEKEVLANELARKFDAFLPQGYSMLSQNYLWRQREGNDEEKNDVAFVESCARTYLAFSTVENSGDFGRL
ncbi:hypothetical protein HJC23_003082 [Cyclotella cryptica]|uniref:Uncharacterized protein n=1 Tax=Cyclotella cryptica TaxID=29204 RepID=A0ABD3P6H8_9STRA